MQYLGAALLALLGVLTFPFNARFLTTGPGLVFATLSLLFLFFAYRAATHRKAVELPAMPVPQAAAASEVSTSSAYTAKPPPEAHPLGQADGVSTTAAQPLAPRTQEATPVVAPSSEFTLTPSTPDITRGKPVSRFMAGRFFVTFYEDLKTMSELHDGVRLPLRHIFAASVFDSVTKKVERLFTLEAGRAGSILFCVFERDGAHGEIGEGGPLMDLEVFEAAVMRLACSLSGVPEEEAHQVAL